MKKIIVGNLIAFGFMVGCGAGVVMSNYIVPPAVSQDTQRWDYTCVGTTNNHEKHIQRLKEHGAEGWEFISETSGYNRLCFRRPL